MKIKTFRPKMHKRSFPSNEGKKSTVYLSEGKASSAYGLPTTETPSQDGRSSASTNREYSPPINQQGGRQSGPSYDQRQSFAPTVPQQQGQIQNQKGQSGGKVLRLIPLGGVGLVQKNMFVYEYGDDIVIIDCGVGFPDEGMPGVDLIIPDISYLKDKKHMIRGIVITHAHDDHIGALPYLWPDLGVPIYSQKLTCGFIKNKFIEHKLPLDVIKTLKIDDTLQLGVFKISFYQVSHSVPDSTGIVLETPVGNLLHQADFKIDWTPVNGQVTDVAKAAEWGGKGIQLLTIDSLGVEKPGYTLSEKTIEPTFHAIEEDTKGKLIITLMTSNITRIQQALNVAQKSGRKVAIAGRSMENNFQVSRDLGYLDIPPNLLIKQEEIKSYDDEKLMLIVAGSLGQPGSALSRAANGDHRFIQINKNDTVVFSADPMPSAVVNQGALIDQLTKLGATVIASTITPALHVSGHASLEEIKMMVNLIKPKYIMPMGGEFKHMKAFQRVAMDMGYREDQILLPDEGEVLNISKDKVLINGKVETFNVYVDGLGVGDVGSIVLRDRQVMSAEGIVVVVVPIDVRNGQVAGEPDVISRGFVFEKESADLIEEAREIVKSCLKDRGDKTLDWRYSRSEIENNLEKFFFKQTKRNPLIVPIVVEV